MNDEIPPPDDDAINNVVNDPRFGKQANPYSLESMRKAYQKVYPSTRSAELADSLIQPNYVYVRFLPKDTTDVKVLFAEDIELYNYPLDYEILGDLSDYHDPTVPIDQITWQYAVLPIEQPLPKNVQCEEIDRCFIPTPEMANNMDSGLDYRIVEKAAFEEVTDESGHIVGGGSGGITTPTYHGTISVYDDALLGYVGVKGVKVRARNFLKIRTGYTNKDGEYNIGCFSDFIRTPRYELRFENQYGFKIGMGLALVLPMSSNMGGATSFKIDKTATHKTWAAATINNAAYDWFNECSKTEIYSPPRDLYIWGFEDFSGASCMLLHHGTYPFTTVSQAKLIMAICSLDITAIAAVPVMEGLITLIGPDVTVCKLSQKTSSQIYNQVCHELSHASHFLNLGDIVPRASWWANVIDYEASCIAVNILNNNGMDPYSAQRGVPFDEGPCSVTEMWAHSMGDIMQYEKYPPTSGTTLPAYIGEDEWFKPQILWDLYFAKQLTKKQIYDCLTRDVTSLDALKSKLVSKYPAKADTINARFTFYNPMLPR